MSRVVRQVPVGLFCEMTLLEVQGAVMMLAGYETSSSTIANACYLLSHPDNKAALSALTSEVDSLDKHADPEQILSLTYLDAAVKETLRLMPPAHVTAREASRDMMVGGGMPETLVFSLSCALRYASHAHT